jgi:leucyl/phenylalanyl-tRNA--protein transferase
VEPPLTPWELPDLGDPALDASYPDDVIARGADLEPGTLLAAYRRGLFPMPERRGSPVMTWWSPVQRGVLPLDGLRLTRSLVKSRRAMEVRFDTAFEAVVAGCADPSRPDGWIDPIVAEAYRELYRLGWAHSVEAWVDGELVGGLYGVAIGGLFAGESMFHRVRDASKVALVGLVELLCDEYADARLLDVQWRTEHLASLGVVEVPRAAYVRALRSSLQVPLPAAWR